MKKLNFYLRIIFIYLAMNSTNLFAFSESKIIANVNNQIISSFEFENKVRTILFLSGQEMSQSNINNAKMNALSSLINYKVKKAELLKYEISLSSNKAQNYLQNISSKFNTDAKGLEKIFELNNLDFEFYLEEINIEIGWQQLIYDIYRNKIVLDEDEINDQISKLIEDQKKIDDFNLAEIEISIGNNLENKKKILDTRNEIKKYGFESTAVKFSIADTAFSNGSLGWVNSQAMSKRILKIVNKMKIGEVSEPIIQTNSILFLKLIDKKTLDTKDIDLKDIKNKVINAKRNELLNLFSNSHLSKSKNNALIKINE